MTGKQLPTFNDEIQEVNAGLSIFAPVIRLKTGNSNLNY